MSDTLRVVFMGSPEFAVPTLEALLRSEDVIAVVSQPDKPRGRGQAQIRGNRHHNRGADAAVVEFIGLHDEDRPAVSGT